ncbi:MAG TPA: ribosome small subunit-dependent GTPase A [Planctomycetota bacterium]
MHPDDKRRFVERARRALDRHLSYEETKRRKAEARRRRAERLPRGPRERVELGDEIEDAEPADAPRRRRHARPGEPAPERGGEPELETAKALATARVIGLARTRATLLAGAETLEAVFAPGLELAVGDRVRFERPAGGLARVREVLPRASWLARPDPAGTGQLVLAANVELVCAVVAARAPRWKPGFVDRVWLAAEEGGAQVLVVVNKLDLLAPQEEAELERELAPYLALGLAVVRVSAVTRAGLDELASALSGRTCVLVGPSGVGKSSLANALDPTRARATGAVRPSDGKGRHTTSASEWVELANGTVLIDTPGLRHLGLLGLDARALAASFPELVALAPRCRFRDCSHQVEPGCAVQAALAAGTLDRRRFESYCRMQAALRASASP